MQQQLKNHPLTTYLTTSLLLIILISMLTATTITANADGGGVNASLKSGGLTVTSDYTGATATLNLNGQYQLVTLQLPISVTDATGSGGGWSLTITSTQYLTSSVPVHKLSVTASSIIGVSLSCGTTSPCTNPGNTINYPLPIPAAATAPPPQKFFQAITKTGLGTFTITPSIVILIPANTYAGAYNSTATLTVVSGP